MSKGLIIEPVVEKTADHYPAITNEARENEMISLAVDLAEQQLRDGTASAQVIVHYLKLGSTREKLEKEKLKQEKELLEIKAKNIQESTRVEQLYLDAINAMKMYSGNNGN